MKLVILFYALNSVLVAFSSIIIDGVRKIGPSATLNSSELNNTENEDLFSKVEHKCQTCSPKDIELRISDSLRTFVNDLKKFITSVKFDYHEFWKHKKALRDAILDMEFLAETELDNGSFEYQLKFAKTLFETMDQSAAKLKRFSAVNSPVHRLIYNLIDLKIRSLALYDSHGTLDRGIREYADKISSYDELLSGMDTEMGNTAHVSNAIWRTYTRQSAKVGEILEDLKRQLP